ncbi:MAG: response regulator [Oscillospiraceae bacterium]|jgi:two-component system response regulator YesN|nr:response regulator [Oscillospiraceae bacterium]
MYRMVIVDDSELTRRGICESVNWELMDIEIVGEAANGLEAMLLIHDQNPDILICDVRMPKLDGIALVGELQPSHPSLQVIFLSGYSEKEYLKNAIKLNAVDYIYKPFQLHELVAAVEKAKRNCMQRKPAPQGSTDDALLLLQYAPDDPQFARMPLDFASNMATMIIHMDTAGGRTADSGYDSQLEDRLIASRHYVAFRSEAEKLFGSRFVMSSVGSGYLLHANVPPDFLGNAKERLAPFLTVIDGTQAGVAVGVSGLSADVSELRRAYGQARLAVHAAFLLGYGRVILHSELSGKPFVPAPDLQGCFYTPVQNSNFTAAIGFLEDYIDGMAGCRVQDIPRIKEALASLAFWLSEEMQKYAGVPEAPYLSERIHYAPDLQSVREYLMGQLQQHIGNLSSLDNKGRIVLEVEQYILANFDRDLSIREIAQQVYITPNYLCYLYKKNTGRTLSQFILDVRMEKASRMVRETSMKLGEVSDALGYANQNYFTRLFTKYFGESPRAYRDKHGRLPLPPSDDEG